MNVELDRRPRLPGRRCFSRPGSRAPRRPDGPPPAQCADCCTQTWCSSDQSQKGKAASPAYRRSLAASIRPWMACNCNTRAIGRSAGAPRWPAGRWDCNSQRGRRPRLLRHARPGRQASTRAGTCSEVHRVESGRPLISTTTVGVPVRNDRLDQFLLHAGQIQARHVVPLPIGGRRGRHALMLPLADHHNGGVRAPWRRARRRRTRSCRCRLFRSRALRDLGLRRDRGLIPSITVATCCRTFFGE